MNNRPYSSIATSFDDDPSESGLVYNGQRAQRAGSEPSEQLLSSIPFHRRTKQQASLTRHVSDADSRFPGASDLQLATSSEPKNLISPVDTLGLRLLHGPPNADVDFIFVHGLGGSSLRTWSFGRNPENFWPLWLTKEPELSHVRIFSFGYNANFRGGSTSLHITDFAKDLLLQMLTFADDSSAEAGTGIGQVRGLSIHTFWPALEANFPIASHRVYCSFNGWTGH